MINKVLIKFPIRLIILFVQLFPHILWFSIFLVGGYFEFWNLTPTAYCINKIEGSTSSFPTIPIEDFSMPYSAERISSIGSASSLINSSFSITSTDNSRLSPIAGRILSSGSIRSTRGIYVTIVPAENLRTSPVVETTYSIESVERLINNSSSVVLADNSRVSLVARTASPIRTDDLIVSIPETNEDRLSAVILPAELASSGTPSSENLYINIDDDDEIEKLQVPIFKWFWPTCLPGCSNNGGMRWAGAIMGFATSLCLYNSGFSIMASQNATCWSYDAFNALFGFGG